MICIVASTLLPLATSTIDDHKNMVYVLPRPGVKYDEDCYLNMYADEINRDLDIIAEMGATTLLTVNQWDFNSGHDVLLTAMNRHNISLGISFKADLDGVARRNLEKLKVQLTKFDVNLEFVLLDYPLDFENAEDFFIWVVQVKGWMEQQEIKAPILVKFFPEVSSDVTIENLLERWDSELFDAWVVDQYSISGMENWLTEKLKYFKKKAFFLYGADRWDTMKMLPNEEDQGKQLEELLLYVMQDHPKSSVTNYTQLYGSALLSYSDIFYYARGAKYFQGGKGDICPDGNPYLQTSCGGVDDGILYGDSFYSIEYMGLFEHYETISYHRCVKPGTGAKVVKKIWKGKGKDSIISDETCVLSLSVPGQHLYFVWAGGLVMAIFGVILGSCKSCQKDRQRKRREFKKDEMGEVLVDSNVKEPGEENAEVEEVQA